MIEQKLLVGRFINLSPQGTKPVPSQGNFVTQVQLPLTIQESSGMFTKTSAVVQGTGAKAHRNFQWLYWLPGSICQVPFGGLDVLTGPMSGCWITNYKIAGIEYVGHIGTDMNPGTANSIAAKNAWNNFANNNPLDVLGGFKPSWNGPIPPSTGDDSWKGCKVFWLVTRREYFTIVTYPQNSSSTLYRIAGVQQNPSAPLATLQNL